MYNKVIKLLHSAKREGVDIILNDEQLQIKTVKNKKINHQLLDAIKDNKKLIIDFLNDNKWKSQKISSEENIILPFDRDLVQRIPLSYSQERLWFIDQLGGSVEYHIPHVFRLSGRLNVEALELSFREIVNRHEVLRTVIREQEGEVWQEVQGKGGWRLPVMDDVEYKEDIGLRKYIDELTSRAFDLSGDYMLRGTLIRLEAEEYVLVVVLHHIASDGWSTSIMVKELVELYAAYTEGRSARLSQLVIQYADYAIWQRKHLQGEVIDRKIGYWVGKLSGVSPLDLPTDHVRPAVQGRRGGVVGFGIEKGLTEQLLRLSKQQGVTLYMTLLSAFKVLLYRYSGQEDICVGSPVAGRQQQETEGLIGFFINMLALRSDLGGNPSFTGLLQQVKETTLGGYEHQEVPFEKVVDAVVRERDLSRSPLFQVMFVLQNTPEVPTLRMREGMELSAEAVTHSRVKFDLSISITEVPAGLRGSMEYDSDLYRTETIERMLGHYKQLLQSIVREPGRRIGELSMLTEWERHELFEVFNNTAVDYPKDKTVVELFGEQAARTPEAVAVVYEEQSLTYRELDERSNQLGHYLRKQGVVEGTLVPICIDRSIEMIVGILGILKAGGAYVPIDPSYPAERKEYMLADSGASVVVSSENSSGGLGAGPGRMVITMDGDRELMEKEPVSAVRTDLRPEGLAYVIYTSGSTGRPKGVMIAHKGIVNRLSWGQDYFKLSAKDVVLQKTTFCFDISVWELLWPLLAGSRLVFAEPGGQRDTSYLKSLIERQKITIIHFVPSMLEEFLADVTPGECESLHKILCSGEVLKGSQVELCRSRLPHVELHNLYGPTEASIEVTCWTMSHDSIVIKTVPIGKPVANTSICILDGNRNLMPVGVIGEIHIGGVQLARGYLNLPELTSEKFIANPFSADVGSRLYRTGDLGKWLPDGNIEYIGRMDDQVKIRGYRIEPGEVEEVLQESAVVRQCAVVVREDVSGNKRLVGYVVPEGVYDRAGILLHLRSRLPEYLVPSVLVELERLPLTSNGKIDRKGLPEPEAQNKSVHTYIGPRNQIEIELAEIWKRILKVEKVSIYDNFFELGGHSLLASRVVSAVYQQLKIKLTIKILFKLTTIELLAQYIEIEQSNHLIDSTDSIFVKL